MLVENIRGGLMHTTVHCVVAYCLKRDCSRLGHNLLNALADNAYNSIFHPGILRPVIFYSNILRRRSAERTSNRRTVYLHCTVRIVYL